MRSGSVWRRDLRSGGEKAVQLAVGERGVGEESGDRRLQRQPHPELGDHVHFIAVVEVGLDGRGAVHHVEAPRPDLGHVALHDAVAALRHGRRLGQRPFRAHAERKGGNPRGPRDRPAHVEMAFKLGRCFVGRIERGARQFELSARLQRNRRRARRVIEADQTAGILEPLPAEFCVDLLEQSADPRFAFIEHGGAVGAIEQDLLVLGADPERAGGLASRLEPGGERVARFDNFPIDDVASHKGGRPLGRRAGEWRLDSGAAATMQMTPGPWVNRRRRRPSTRR